jgi:chemotaxis protein CheX
MGRLRMEAALMPANSAHDQAQWAAHIDSTVAEVFETMLSQGCTVVCGASLTGVHISAKTIFSGTLEGHCMVHVSTATADLMTDALLGAEGDWDDQMIDDAVGELCNMIAGGWKSRLGTPASVCHLSAPTVSRRAVCEGLHGYATMMRRFYAFSGSMFEVTLALR